MEAYPVWGPSFARFDSGLIQPSVCFIFILNEHILFFCLLLDIYTVLFVDYQLFLICKNQSHLLRNVSQVFEGIKWSLKNKWMLINLREFEWIEDNQTVAFNLFESSEEWRMKARYIYYFFFFKQSLFPLLLPPLLSYQTHLLKEGKVVPRNLKLGETGHNIFAH